MKEGQGGERYWQAHIGAWQRSGLSQREYCKRQGLQEWALSQWKGRLAKRCHPAPINFVPVVASKAPTATGAGDHSRLGQAELTLVIDGGYRIEIGQGFHDGTLTRLLAVLGRQ